MGAGLVELFSAAPRNGHAAVGSWTGSQSGGPVVARKCHRGRPAAGGLPDLSAGRLGYGDWSPPQSRRGPAECEAFASCEVLRLVTDFNPVCLLGVHSRICVLPL